MFIADKDGIIELSYVAGNISGTFKITTNVPFEKVSVFDLTVPNNCKYSIVRGEYEQKYNLGASTEN